MWLNDIKHILYMQLQAHTDQTTDLKSAIKYHNSSANNITD